MTAEEFCDQFKEVAKTFQWGKYEGTALRGLLLGEGCSCCKCYFCPITAFVRKTKNHVYLISNWGIAAQEIGLSLEEAGRIVKEADNEDYGDKDIRQRLEAAINASGEVK